MYRRNVGWMIVVAIGSVACWQAAQSAPQKDEDAELYRLFVDALEHVDRSYVKTVNRRELVEAAINGMLENLDPYSNFYGEKEAKQFDRQTKGKFGGIGVQIGLKEKDETFLTVISPLVGTPAYEAGLLAGDRITHVNGESVKGLSQSDVVDRLTGPAGSEVKLTVSHPPYTSEFEVTLIRATINMESVLGDQHGKDDQWDFMLDKENKIAYIRISSFFETTKDELEKAIGQAMKEGMKGLIIDLRFNPGGLLSAAIGVSDLFVSEGRIVSTEGRNTEPRRYDAEKEGTLPDFPLAILVNHYSASASEIVSACLQDHGRAVVIGERTWGKGSVQNVISLEDGNSVLKLTTASYQRPSGHNIHRFKDSSEKDEWGVKPDPGFEVKLTPAEERAYLIYRQERDRVLGKPTELKKNREAFEKYQAEQKKIADAKKKASEKDGEKTEPAKPFVDLQLNRALAYLREKTGAKPAENKEKPDVEAEPTKKAS